MSFNREIYNINFKRLARQFVKNELKGKKFLSAIYAFTSFLQKLHSEFLLYKKSVEYRLLISPQVCYLEKALNDKYDIVDRRIFISPGVEYQAWVIYNKVEGIERKKVLYTKAEATETVVYSKSEAASFGVDFFINVPAVISFNQQELLAYIGGYCLPLKYRIRFI